MAEDGVSLMAATRKGATYDDLDKFIEHGVYWPTRTLYLGSVGADSEGGENGVNWAMAERAIKALHALDHAAPKPPADAEIQIILSSYGGDVYYGYAIYDAIKACQNRVVIRATGPVMSMGALILQAGDERVLSKNARVMLHYGTAGFNDHVKNVMRWNEEYKRILETDEEILLARIREKHPAFQIEKLREMMQFDYIITADEAVALGLADRVA